MTNETLFIGTSHIDPEGYTRLMPLLEDAGPDIIIVEVSHLSLLLRRTYGRLCRIVLDRNIRKMKTDITPEIRDIRNYFDIPYEYRAARDYCRKTGAASILADVSLFSIARFFHAFRLVTKKNISAASQVHGDRFKQERGIALSIFSKNDRLLRDMKLSQFRRESLAIRRESILLHRVTRMVRTHAGKKIVYAGGWEHMIDDPESGLLYTAFPLPKKRIIAFIDTIETNDLF